MSQKKLFSGNSIRQALLAAASHFDLPADRIAYRELEKKHGFLKAKKRVVIEVDTEAPTRPVAADKATDPAAAGSGAEATPVGEAAPQDGRGRRPRTRRPEPAAEDASAVSGGSAEPVEGEETPEEASPARRRRSRSASTRAVAGEKHTKPEEDGTREKETAAADEDDDDREDTADDDREEDQDQDQDQDQDDDDEEDDDEEGTRDREPSRPVGSSPTAGSAADSEEAVGGRRRRRRGGRGRGAADAAGATEGDDDGDLIDLPEHPRRPSERFSEARGPLADATRQALDRVLEVAGLELSYTVLQGDDRLEVDLTGRDEALLVAEGGELLRAVEHLVPRVVRSIVGESVSVRVDSADFHEIHEEQLRSLAQRVASEVRRSERPRTLEPMSPADRRIVHITLADEPRVTSMSEGSGFFKRIVVKPN